MPWSVAAICALSEIPIMPWSEAALCALHCQKFQSCHGQYCGCCACALSKIPIMPLLVAAICALSKIPVIQFPSNFYVYTVKLLAMPKQGVRPEHCQKFQSCHGQYCSCYMCAVKNSNHAMVSSCYMCTVKNSNHAMVSSRYMCTVRNSNHAMVSSCYSICALSKITIMPWSVAAICALSKITIIQFPSNFYVYTVKFLAMPLQGVRPEHCKKFQSCNSQVTTTCTLSIF